MAVTKIMTVSTMQLASLASDPVNEKFSLDTHPTRRNLAYPMFYFLEIPLIGSGMIIYV